MINSKNKGSRNERGVAKLFTNWTSYEFARTPQSGGLHWKKQNTVGDIVCISETHGRRFPFSIECKSHSEIDFSYLIDDTKGKKSNKIIHFWNQAEGDAKGVNKIPLLFFRRNLMKADTHFVGLPAVFYNLLIMGNPDMIPSLGSLTYHKEPYSLVFINSEDFFKWDYKICYKMARKLNRINDVT